MTQGNIYLDFNATTPVDPVVQAQVPEWLDFWGNPSSIHHHGRGPKKLLRESRRSLAQNLNCHPLELVFTSGGTESNNLAIKGSLQELKKKHPHKNKVLIGAIEHPSVLKQVFQIEEMGFSVKLIPVNSQGQYDLEFYNNELDETVALVSVMYANNEIGVLSPLEEMIPLAHEHKAVFHSDMVQALGKVAFDLKKLNVDLASFSSHKIYALNGCGLLYVKKGTAFDSLTQGGRQERARRAGTENLLAIASFAKMVGEINTEIFKENLEPLREVMENDLKQSITGFKILGEESHRLPNTSCFTIEGTTGESLLMNLDIRGFSVGTGAACSSGNPEPSPVLLALGLSHEQAQSSLRISFGKTTTEEHVKKFTKALIEVVNHLRSLNPETGEVHV